MSDRMPVDFHEELTRRLGRDAASVRQQIDAVVSNLRNQVAQYGHARLPGLGTLRSAGGRLVFEPDAALARAVNHRYESLDELDVEAPPTRAAYHSDRLFDAGADEPVDAPPVPEEPDEPETGPADEPPPDLPEADTAPPAAKPAGPEASSEEPLPPGEGEADEQEPEEPSVLGVPVPRDADDEEDLPYWISGEPEPEEHPLGSASEQPFEEADFSFVDEDRDEDDRPSPFAPPPLTPASTTSAGAEEEGEPEGPPTVRWEQPDAADQRDEWAPPVTPPEAESETISDREEEAAPEPAPPVPPADAAAAESAPPEAAPPRPASREHRVQRGPNRFAQEQERSRAPWIVGGVVAILVLAIGAWWILERMTPPEPVLEGYTEAERPVPADTGLTAADPADTLAADVAADAPAPVDTPLHSADGLDAAADGYTVVVASETSRSAAEAAAEAYADQGFRAGIVAGTSGGVTRYRVGVGQFETLARAEAVRDSLRGGPLPDDAWVTRVR